MTKTEEDELAEFAKFLMEKGDAPEEPVVVTIAKTIPDFSCLGCGKQFSRVRRETQKKCPFCKSEIIVRQTSNLEFEAKRYDVDPADAIMGPRGSKYSKFNSAKRRRGH